MEAFVLRNEAIAEADLSVALLTREGRRIEGFARSARQPSSRLRAGILPFTVSDLNLVPGRRQWIVRSALPLLSFSGLRSSSYGLAGALAVSAVLAEALPDAPEPNLYAATTRLFRDLHVAIVAREGRSLLTRRVAAAILKALALIGLVPPFDQCVRCGTRDRLAAASPSAGGVLCGSCASDLPDSRSFSSRALADLGTRKIPASEGDVRELALFLGRFASWHLPAASAKVSLAVSMCGGDDFRVR